MSIPFETSAPFSIGAELELQLIDRKTFDLSSSSIEVMKSLKDTRFVSPELYQSMIELTTGVCHNAHEVSAELSSGIARVSGICDKLNIDLVSAGTHPWSHHVNAQSFPRARFDDVLARRKWAAKRLLVFGLHVHVGMRSGDHAIRTMNALLDHMPMLLALSASSPFYSGENTHMDSTRSTFFEAIPTASVPSGLKAWQDFQFIYSRMLGSGAVASPKDLWWDVRPSPGFGTLEIRICDSPSTLREATAVVAWIHLLCLYAEEEFLAGLEPKVATQWVLHENKWRAMKDGVLAELIESESGFARPMDAAFEDLVQKMSHLIRRFAYQPQIEVLRRIFKSGNSSERQREVFENSKGDLKAVVGVLIEELQKDRPLWLSEKRKGKGKCAS